MKKLVFSIIMLGGCYTNAQQLLEVLKPTGPIVTFGSGETMLLSVYDNKYRHYQPPTTLADWEREEEGTDNLVDYQGKITEDGLEIRIPITVIGEGSTTISAFTSAPITIPIEKTQDGHSKQIVVSWTEHTNITQSSTYITAKIKTLSGVLNIKKLDINRGVGSDVRGVHLADIIYPKVGENGNSSYSVRVIAGIPDKNYDTLTNGEYRHRFIYMPLPLKREIEGEVYDKIWLNYNLGADYTNLLGNDFNPIKQASYDDEKAFGSYFQWQRPADGHELKDAPQVLGFYDGADWAPGHNRALYGDNADPYSWVTSDINLSPDNKDLWKTGGANNPCPIGFHVPTQGEWDDMNYLYKGNKVFNSDDEQIDLRTFLHLAGYKAGVVVSVGTGNYANSDHTYGNRKEDQAAIYYVSQNGGGSPSYYGGRYIGLSVRCIQD